MRAAVYRRFGGPDTVGVDELPRPSVGPDDVLVRVHASTVSAADHRTRSREVPRGLGLLAAVVSAPSGPSAACWAWAAPASSRPSGRG